MEFKDWISKKYTEWRGETIGNDGSITKFASYLGVSHQVLTGWMAGVLPNRHSTIEKIASKYSEVYEILEKEDPLSSFPPDMRKRIRAAKQEIESELKAKNIPDNESPEAESIAIKVMEKYGFKYVETQEN